MKLKTRTRFKADPEEYFWHILALEFKEPDVDKLKCSIPATQFDRWMAFYKLNPFGEHRADIRNAMLMKLLVDINSGKKAKKYKLTDFMPDFEGNKIGKQEESLMSKFDAAWGFVE